MEVEYTVNYLRHQLEANRRLMQSPTARPIYISLYTAISFIWNRSGHLETISVCREELMNFSKIGSKTYYLRSLRWLEKNGFIRYQPSNDPLTGSLIQVILFEDSFVIRCLPTTIPTSGSSCEESTEKGTGNGSDTELGKVQGPYIKPSKEVKSYLTNKGFKPPLLDEVKSYFSSLKRIDQAEMFFSYYTNDNWKGCREKGWNWKISAQKWVARNFQKNESTNNSDENYDYDGEF